MPVNTEDMIQLLINLKVVKYILKTLAEYYTKFFKIKRIT